MAVFYREEKGSLVRESSLFEALKLPNQPRLTVSLVGAGGKTSTMYRLADELAGKRKRVVVTTSTHIFHPEDRQVVVTGNAADVLPFIRPGKVVVAGQSLEKQGEIPRKLSGLPPAELEKLAVEADVLLVEADGAKRLPLKVPGAGEPVIPAATDVVIACAGLDSIGESLEKACFRFKTDGSWVRDESPEPAAPIGPEDLARILTDERGARKGVEDREYRIVLNKADSEARRAEALRVISRIRAEDEVCCAVSGFMIQENSGAIAYERI